MSSYKKLNDKVFSNKYKTLADIIEAEEREELEILSMQLINPTNNEVVIDMYDKERDKVAYKDSKWNVYDRDTCKTCKHLFFSDCYGECNKHLGIVQLWDSCSEYEKKSQEN